MTIEDIALQMTPGIGIKGAVHLLERFGDARSIFAATADELAAKAGLRPDTAQQLVRRKGFPAAERELAHCRRNGIAAVASTDPEYPQLLREITDYPHVIYIKGCVEALSARCISIVGTREATPYGQTACNRLVGGLAERVPRLSVVSGLAFGIDVAAHRAALEAGVQTVAVVANPLPGVTPAQHTDVARDILAHGGALITELHSQSKQNGNFYLARNRIIAGLSAGCIVVESPDSAEKIFDQIGACPCCRTWEKANVWGSLRPDVTVHKGEALFPRIDAEKALAELNAIQEAQRKAALPALELEPYTQEQVDFDTFCKSDFRAVKIKNCEAVKKSDKLLKFTLDDGSGTDRTIVSGIRHYYQPEQLIGKTAVAILNLPPRKMMGIPSCGMLISAVHKEKGEEKLHLLLLDDAIPAGAKLC